MKQWNKLTCAALLLLSAVAGNAMAETVSQGNLTIKDPWTRPTPPGVTMGVGYMSIHNAGSADVTLIGAASAKSDDVTIHKSVMDDGVVSMQFVEGGLTIPAGKTVMLKPHGYHLMLEGLDRGISRNETVPVTLTFENADAISVELHAKPMDESASEHTVDH